MDQRTRRSSVKRKLSNEEKASEGKAPKKIKKNDGMKGVEVFEKRMREVLKTSIEIYHGCNHKGLSEELEEAHLSILKRLCNTDDWLHSRIISNKLQIRCFTGETDLTEDFVKKFKSCLDSWIKYRISKVPGKNKTVKCDLVAQQYRNFIFPFGVKSEAIDDMMQTKRNLLQKERDFNLNISDFSHQTLFNDHEFGNCRLCGVKNTRLIVDLNSMCLSNHSFKEMVEVYCR